MEQLLELVRKILSGSAIDFMSVIAPFSLGIICILLAKYFRKENDAFSKSIITEGVIIDIQGYGNSRYPTIEYCQQEGAIQFKSSLATLNGEVGDKVKLEISSAGKVRLESKENMQYEKLMPFFCAFSFALSGLFLYVNFIK